MLAKHQQSMRPPSSTMVLNASFPRHQLENIDEDEVDDATSDSRQELQ
jgi:hypothetical protein